MATPERVEIVAPQQNEDSPSAPRGTSTSPDEPVVAAIPLRSLPQPPMLLSSGVVEILASLGTTTRKAA
jgi:hypothetical protein